ncbi:hypothetical protein [Streptomyces sp. NPDC002580]|uniref:hypothetical protein n=1 Tax=Streptomyces sp. NPDC002580 TaxID=3364653 RepID=UPI0036CECC66
MSGLVDAGVIRAVAALVIARRLRAHRIDVDGRWWIGPAVLAFLAFRGAGPIDPHHEVEASILLCAELLLGLAATLLARSALVARREERV